MNDQFEQILNNLPDKTPRSQLAPYTEFIEELRRRGRTYREIAAILAQNFQLHVASSTVVRFVAGQSRQRRKVLFQDSERAGLPIHPSDVPTGAAATTNIENMDQMRRRIQELRQTPAQGDAPTKVFNYDPDQPLTLVPRTDEDESGALR
jgi:hypothetical protein